MSGRPSVSGGAALLASDFLRFSLGRSAVVLGLIAAAAVVEGAGILMLVPMLTLVLGGGTSFADPIFDAVGLTGSGGRIVAALTAFAALLAVRFFVLLHRDDKVLRLQLGFVASMRARAFRNIAAKPWAEVAELRQGPAGHALMRDVDRIGFGANMVIQSCIAVVMLLVQLALALALAPVVTLITATLGLALFRSLRWLRLRAERHGTEMTAEDLTMFLSVGRFLGGLKPAKAHGLERDYVGAFESAVAKVTERQRAFAWDNSLARQLLQAASGAIGIVAVLIGAFVLETPPENLVVTLVILARLYSPLQTVQNALQGIRHAAAAYMTVRAFAEAPTEALPAGPAAQPFDAAPEIRLAGVEVRGREGVALLRGVDLVIPAGQVTVVGGDSGAGKSTLCDLVGGLLTPDGGEMTIDGRPVDAGLAGRLRASLAYVGQEPFLFEGSLRDNLVWGCGPVRDAAIWETLSLVGAVDLARGLEGGLDGRVRADGSPFSGGERQRFRLARALLRRPRLLVLDEATNALDHEAEERVLGAVLAARRGATAVLVSHRPENRRLADRVVVLERGRVVSIGSGSGPEPAG